MARSDTRLPRALVSIMAVSLGVLAGSALIAAEPDAKEKPKKAPAPQQSKTYTNADLKERGDAARTFTNEDLERMFGPAPAASAAAEASANAPAPSAAAPAGEAGKPMEAIAEDPLKALLGREAARADRQQRIAAAEAELQAARDKLKNLEVQLLAARNPYAARPQLSEEEKDRRATTQENAADRYERTQKLVEEARQEIAAAEAKLQKAHAE